MKVNTQTQHFSASASEILPVLKKEKIQKKIQEAVKMQNHLHHRIKETRSTLAERIALAFSYPFWRVRHL